MISKGMKIAKFLSYYRPYRVLFVLDMFCALASSGLYLILPICVRHITENILAQNAPGAATEILKTGAIMVSIIVIMTAFIMFYDYKGHDMGAKIERDMRAELFQHLQKLPFSFYDSQKTGSLMSRLTNDLNDIAELCHHGPEQILIYGTQFFGSLIILFFINVKLTLVLIGFLPVFIAYSCIFYVRMQAAYQHNRERIADVNAYAQENLSGIRVVQSFAAQEHEMKRFGRENDKFYRSRRDIYKKEMQFDSIINCALPPLLTAVIVVCGGLWILEGQLELPTLLVFVLYAAYMTGPLPRLAFMVQQYQHGLSGYRRFREICDIVPDIRDGQGAVDLKVERGEVRFDNVSFRYGEANEYVLNNVYLCVHAGETIAIVGKSGIGKTTLCSLIPRFYDAECGDIFIDDVNIRDVTLHSLRSQIGVVRQDTFLFSGTVLENIAYGSPNARREQIIDAAKRANAYDFIMELPHGFDTEIGQRGIRLSGGQQQRISIARVFLKNPPILILDEATSALDYESERAVMQSLRELAHGRTTFIIAHRLSTIEQADKIVVLSDCGLSEQGSHEELMAKGGEYARLYNAQS